MPELAHRTARRHAEATVRTPIPHRRVSYASRRPSGSADLSLVASLHRAPVVQAVAARRESLNRGPHAAALARMSSALQASDRLVAQRFPNTVYTTAYNWSTGQFTVAPLGGGTMAALFKLTQTPPVPGEIDTVIVKALEVDEPDSIRLGETFLRQMGMALPHDRIIMPGTAEFGQLAAKLGLPTNPHGQYLANNKIVGGLLLMQDLGTIGATTIQSKLMQATTRAEIDDVFAWMTDPVVLAAVGKSIAYDSAIGNFDRITMDAQNFGNLMIRRGGAAATQVFLIDTNARLPRLREQILAKAEAQGAFYEDRVRNSTLLKGLFDHPDWAIGNWLEAIPAMIQAQQQVRVGKGQGRIAFLDQENAYITQKVNTALTTARPIVQAAYDQALIDLRTMMANKADPRRQAIKAAATGTQSFDTLKANVAYLEQRTRPAAGVGQIGPLAHTPAASIVETYGRYKVAKATAGLPVNAAPDPAAIPALAVPKSLRAGKVKEKLKGDTFKTQQSTDFGAFHPQFLALQTNIERHTAYLRELKLVIENAVKLQRSVAGPGETRNQRALVSIQKRTTQFNRLRALLQQPARDGVTWADAYERLGSGLVPGLNELSDRYNNLRDNGVPELLQAIRDLTAIRTDVHNLSTHL